MSTQGVLPFPCRKPRSLTGKMSSQSPYKEDDCSNLPKSLRSSGFSNLKPQSLCARSIMSFRNSPRRILGEPNDAMSGEDILEAIYKLSPLSPERYSKENITPKTGSKNTQKRASGSNVSPSKTILSPIRALSLNSPPKEFNEDELDAKRGKILQIKMSRISVPEMPKSKVDETPTRITRTRSARKLEPIKRNDETPSKSVSKRVTRSARKAQKLKFEEEESKENVELSPSPTKKSRLSGQRIVRRALLSSPAKNDGPFKPEFVKEDDAEQKCEPPPLQTPKKSSIENIENVDSPQSKRMLRLHDPDALVYQQTKHALHTSVPDELIGREKEMTQISKFISSGIAQGKSGSLYISGAPGTGKSACLMKVLSDDKVTGSSRKKSQVISVNCMSMRNSTAIYNKIALELGAKPSKCKTARSAMKYLEDALTSNGPTVILLLDEMDQLDSKNQEVLYTIFEWPAMENSRLLLVGIANALDLTDRILPRLQSRSTCRPSLINFQPYSKDQIVAILEERIKKTVQESGKERVIDAMAVQFCARKVAAVAGDARKALDICRRAVEMIETSVKTQQVLSPIRENGKNPTPMKKVGLPQIAGVLSSVYESSISARKPVSGPDNTKEEDAFPLQQKLAVCTLILLTRSIKSKEVTLGKLHESYTKICRKRQVTAVGQSEFVSVLQLVETRGILSIKSSKQVRMMKVSLSLQEKDVEYALQDKTLLSSILQEGLPK